MDDNSQEEEELVPLPAVEVGILVGLQILKEIPFSGISSFSLSPSLNLFANNVTLSGLDWVEGLKNLTISSQLTPATLPISTIYLEESLIPVKPNPIIDDINYPLSPLDSLDSRYFLRSFSKTTSEGLGKDTNMASKGRGRKTFISKAQSKAKKDLLEVKQNSIERDIRSMRAQKKGRR